MVAAHSVEIVRIEQSHDATPPITRCTPRLRRTGIAHRYRGVSAHFGRAEEQLLSPTRPASTHCSAVVSKKQRKIGKPRCARILLSDA